MTFRVPRFLAAATAAALVLGASKANATVLVHDGFDLSAGYSAGGLKSQPAAAYRSSQTGFVSAAWSVWNDTSVVYVHGAGEGLSYPASGWEDFTAVDSSIGFKHSTAGAMNRTVYRTMTPATAFADCQKLYFRVLVRCSGTAANLKAATVYGLGLANANPGVSGATDTFGTTGLWLGFRHVSGGTLKAVLNILGTQYEIGDMDQDKTYVMVAEIVVGAGTGGADQVRAFSVPIDDYDDATAYWSPAVGMLGVAEATLVANAATPLSYLVLNGEYGTKNAVIAFDEVFVGTELSDVVPVSTTMPVLTDGALSLSAGVYTASAELSQSDADVTYTLSDGDPATTETPATLGVGAFTAGSTVTGTFAAPADDTTYEAILTAENQGGEKASISLGVLYGGTLSLTKVSDASELGVVPATLTVSRANPDPLPLIVNYSFADGTGAAGVNYVDDAGFVVIPADATSATITVTPLVDVATDTDTTMTVSLAAGNYGVPAAVSVTIANYSTPQGENYWVGNTATAGKYLASTAANWSAGHVPTASEHVHFDGNYSTSDCTWDAPVAVAAWTQTVDYTGTVEFQTTYANGAFPLFSITGDCVVNGGKWTHHSNTNVASGAAAEYRLNVAVGGDFTLGSGARIDLIGLGYNVGRYPAGSQVGVHAATGRGTYAAVYGNVYAPEDVGSGGENGNSNTSAGGGAVKLAVTGTAVIDGTIAANACSQRLSGANPEKGYGAGGSVFVTAGSISGSGTIDVSARPSGVSETAYTGYPGSGGRMALVATSGSVTIPMANLLADGSQGSYTAGGGTIFLKNAADTNGSLLVGTVAAKWSYQVRYPRKDGCTCVKPGETWTFDHIYVRDSGILSVPANATLSLPGGFESISSLTSSSTPLCGILYLGGTISLPARAEHVLSGPWMFMAAEPYTFSGDVRLSSQASIGSLQLYADSVDAYPACTVTVTGDMTVESGASLYANNRGIRGADIKTQGYHGGSVAVTTHHLKAYDSILDPRLGGSGGRSGDMGNSCPAGGAIILTVGGCLTLNGNANAGSTDISAGSHLGAAGTINITAGSIAGSGSITANGGGSGAAKSRGAGGGGRISVRLTDAGATFADFLGTISAQGNNANSATVTAGSSAGTVYLQDGNTAAGAGTIRVANISPSTAADARTGFPSLSNGAVIDDLSKASLEITNNSRIILIADVEVEAVDIESGSSIDLNGHSITVRAARAGGVKIPPGIYADGATLPIGSGTLDDYLLDTAAGGSLVVRSRATIILLQ